MDERALAERLITYDTSTPGRDPRRGGLREGLAGVRRDRRLDARLQRPARAHGRRSGDARRRRSSCTATSTSCPGLAEQFDAPRRGRPADRPRRLRHEGRPRRDHVRAARPAATCGAPACASCARPTRSPRTSTSTRPTTWSRAACAATSRSPASRPTSTSASRPRASAWSASRVRGRAAHGSTPWLGDNAILKAIDVFRRIETLPFARGVLGDVRPARRSTSGASTRATPSTRCPTRP